MSYRLPRHVPLRVAYFAGAFALLLLLIGIGTRVQSFPAHPDESYWASRIRADGAKAAYAALAQFLSDKDSSVQHLQAHLFGGALYGVVGVEGLSVCDAQFSYGCYHELLGRAILAEGLGEVALFDQKCDGDDACQHGIGHGVLASIGYDMASLKQALDICRGLPDDEPLLGCDAGVYMEYNLRTMATSDGNAVRSAAADMQAPCDLLSDANSRACYLWQPQWWWVRFSEAEGMSATSSLAAMRDLCHELDAPRRLQCVAGVGMRVPPAARYDGEVTGRFCDRVFSGTEALVCREYAANVLMSTVSDTSARMACEGLVGVSKTTCLSWASGALSTGSTSL